MTYQDKLLRRAALRAECDATARMQETDAVYTSVRDEPRRRSAAREYIQHNRFNRFVKRLFTGSFLFFSWTLILALLVG